MYHIYKSFPYGPGYVACVKEYSLLYNYKTIHLGFLVEIFFFKQTSSISNIMDGIIHLI